MVAKHVSRLALPNVSLATCFAEGAHSNLQLTRGKLKNKEVSFHICYIATVQSVSAPSRVSIIQLHAAVLST